MASRGGGMQLGKTGALTLCPRHISNTDQVSLPLSIILIIRKVPIESPKDLAFYLKYCAHGGRCNQDLKHSGEIL